MTAHDELAPLLAICILAVHALLAVCASCLVVCSGCRFFDMKPLEARHLLPLRMAVRTTALWLRALHTNAALLSTSITQARFLRMTSLRRRRCVASRGRLAPPEPA